jgi:hypothetical protein
MTYAPIALFTYNRADHTRTAVESLLRNVEASQSDLFVFSDGPKNVTKVEGVRQNREYIHTITGFKSVTIAERECNWGLSRNLIAGITELTDKYGMVIVVEDDLIVSPYFLKYMNDALEKYKDDDRVASISAFLNPTDMQISETFFLRYFACWGWATWKRAWKLFNPDSKYLLKKIRWKTNEFNIGGTGPFYGILYCDKVGLNDSWAVRFYASCFLANKLHLFPNQTMAIQSGMDGTGTHSGVSNVYCKMKLSEVPILLSDIPVGENKFMYKAFSRFYGKDRKKTVKVLFQRLKSFIRRLLGVDYC